MSKTVRSYLFVLITLFVSACGGGSSSSSADAAPGDATLRSAAVIGDSISNGFGLADPWPPRLAAALGIDVDNSNSVSGEETPFGLSVIDSVLEQEGLTHLLIMLGTNDAIRGSISAAISNLQQMVDIANGRGVTVIVATLPPITSSGSQNARSSQLSRDIRNLSGASIAEVRGAFGDGSGLLADGIHPNDAGQQLIADAFASAF